MFHSFNPSRLFLFKSFECYFVVLERTKHCCFIFQIYAHGGLKGIEAPLMLLNPSQLNNSLVVISNVCAHAENTWSISKCGWKDTILALYCRRQLYFKVTTLFGKRVVEYLYYTLIEQGGLGKTIKLNNNFVIWGIYWKGHNWAVTKIGLGV